MNFCITTSRWKRNLGVLGLVFLSWGGLADLRAQPRPNIVFILADDLGFGDLQSYGHPRIKTPHLDRLAEQGTRFTQFYQSHSVCSPSRTSLITGQYPSRWHVYAHLAWLRSNAERGMPDWLSVEAPSLPRALQQAGYRTALFGKWHLGGGSGRRFGGKDINSADAPPVTAYGFDEARVVVGNGATWREGERRDEAHDLYPYADSYFVTWSSRQVVDSSLEFIENHQREHADQPFMLNLWFHDPHVPLQPTAEMRAPYADIADRGMQNYYSVVTHMDAQVGRLLQRLDELGLSDNTLVVFTSDNGTPAREGSLRTGAIAPGVSLSTDTAGSNGGLRGWKWHLYEGGVRVPLIVRWPGHVPVARVDADSVLHGTDFIPTLCRLVGANMPMGFQPDGLDVTAAITGKPFVRSQPIFWQNPTAKRRGPSLAVRDGNWKLLMEYDGTDEQLFDLEGDPAELVDVARDRPKVVALLRSQLLNWAGSLPAPLDRVHVETAAAH
jgi:arylsulfatase A-like enzyme